MGKKVIVISKSKNVEGTVTVIHGDLIKLDCTNGKAEENCFFMSKDGRLEISIDNEKIAAGPFATRVNIKTTDASFSFFLRDVNSLYPIYIAAYGFIVTEHGDDRTYGEIKDILVGRKTLSALQRMESEPEETYTSSAQVTRNMKCPIFMGVSRDIRIFESGIRGEDLSSCFSASKINLEAWDWIKPRMHGYDVKLPELGGEAVQYDYMTGRGLGCSQIIERRLEDGILPILNMRHTDDDIEYISKSFVTYEKRPFNAETLEGTHYLISDYYSFCHVLTKEQQFEYEQLVQEGFEQDEETVFYLEIQAVNTAETPKYAWIRLPAPNVSYMPDRSDVIPQYDGQDGFGAFSTDRVFMVAKMNDKPAPEQEFSFLLMPGEKAVFDIMIPHKPISHERAKSLFDQDFNVRLAECVDFFRDRLSGLADIQVPEKRIEEMIKAGALHLDLTCYGSQPNGPLTATVGVYTAIGAESSYIIQFFESMGDGSLVDRAIKYFFKKQRPNGFIQNFQGYMLETGAVLWNVGEHYRYTGDLEFVKKFESGIIKACDYIIQWRKKSEKSDLIEKGYGMIDGKVADPPDNFHSFMLNGYAYLGLRDSGMLLTKLGNKKAEYYVSEAKQLKEDIMKSLERSFSDAPVVPIGDGTWIPAVSPWPEYPGALCLYAEGGSWFTHGAVAIRDSGLGALWYILWGIIGENSQYADFILNMNSEYYSTRNTGFSEPYYYSHPYAHLRRGEVKAFLKEFYNGFSGLSDRETYTFWEHYHHVSVHKTSEEAQFLLRCRWMLFLEDGRSLKLLPGIPSDWLDDGKKVSVKGAKCHFGLLNFEVKSEITLGKISGTVELSDPPAEMPAKIMIRLPHPFGISLSSTNVGRIEGECLIIDDFKGSVNFEVEF